MATIRVLCLAYSRREGGYCFAGLNLESGLWVRPINLASHGALYAHQCFVQTDAGLRDPEILDVIEIEVLSPHSNIAQPENWIIGNLPWKFVGRGNREMLTSYVNADPELFRGYNRDVPASDIAARPPEDSLRLVSPQNLIWSAKRTFYGKRRIEGTFSITGQSYTLPLTDEIYSQHLSDVELYTHRKHDPSKPPILTLSLSDEWKKQKSHYKLIAGVVL